MFETCLSAAIFVAVCVVAVNGLIARRAASKQAQELRDAVAETRDAMKTIADLATAFRAFSERKGLLAKGSKLLENIDEIALRIEDAADALEAIEHFTERLDAAWAERDAAIAVSIKASVKHAETLTNSGAATKEG